MQRLLPGVSVFLDVDDLEEIGKLEEYITASAAISIFLSHYYFKSTNCLREVAASVDQAKPIVLVHEVDAAKGGGPLEEIQIELSDKRLFAGVFTADRQVIPWYRIAEFQLTSLRLIIERTLLSSPAYQGRESLQLYIPGTLVNQKLAFERPVKVFASPNNAGARSLAEELSDHYPQFTFTENLSEVQTPLANDTSKSAGVRHMLLYLNEQTYVGDVGEALAEELRTLRGSLPIVMAHENDPALGGCEFAR